MDGLGYVQQRDMSCVVSKHVQAIDHNRVYYWIILECSSLSHALGPPCHTPALPGHISQTHETATPLRSFAALTWLKRTLGRPRSPASHPTAAPGRLRQCCKSVERPGRGDRGTHRRDRDLRNPPWPAPPCSDGCWREGLTVTW